MSAWNIARLVEVCVEGGIQTGPFGSQLHQSDYSQEGTPVIMPKDIKGGTVDEEGIARVEERHVERLARHKVKRNNIVFPRRGDVAKEAFITEREEGWLCGTGCLKVVLNEDIVSPEFIRYQLSLPNSVKWLETHAVGSTMPNINSTILGDLPITLPPLPVQRRIAAILSDYDSAIANARKQIELLEEAAMRLYREWFVVNADPKWEKVRLGELIERTISGDWGAESSKGKQTEKVVCVRGKDLPALTRREVLNPVFRYVTNAHAIDRSVTVGDLIVEMSGGSPSQSTGRATSISRKMLERFKCKMLCTNFCKVVRPKQGFEYVLALHWKQLYDRNVMFGYELGTTGIKNFQLDRFMNEERIVAVDNEMLSRFNRICQSLFNAMDRIGNKIVVLSEARDRLLPKLMSGEVSV